MVVVGRAQAPPPWEPPPPAEIPPLHPPADPPPQIHPLPPPRVLTDSWGVCRIRTGCSRPPVSCVQVPAETHQWLTPKCVTGFELCSADWTQGRQGSRACLATAKLWLAGPVGKGLRQEGTLPCGHSL